MSRVRGECEHGRPLYVPCRWCDGASDALQLARRRGSLDDGGLFYPCGCTATSLDDGRISFTYCAVHTGAPLFPGRGYP